MEKNVTDLGTEFTNWTSNLVHGLPNTTPTKLDMLPPSALANSSSSLVVKHRARVINKSKQPVFTVNFTAGGKHVLAGLMNGEFSLWQSSTSQFEMVMQAHEDSVRCVKFSNNGDWVISGDQEGVLKVWQPNFNNLKMQKIHQEVLRDLAWSPSDQKFASASDDGSVKVWSFATLSEEMVYQGKDAHGWDVKCLDWHPTMSLIASGSKDNTVRLWDPRVSKPLTTLHEFKNTISKIKFQPAGPQNLLATASRDHTAQVFDLRYLVSKPQPLRVLRGHPSSVSALTWHPIHPNLLSTGTQTGSVHHFMLNSATNIDEVGFMHPTWSIPNAHQYTVWDMAYHPAGHMLATGANDKQIKLWTRAAPGDTEDQIRESEFYTEEGQQPLQISNLFSSTTKPKPKPFLTNNSVNADRPIPGL